MHPYPLSDGRVLYLDSYVLPHEAERHRGAGGREPRRHRLSEAVGVQAESNTS